MPSGLNPETPLGRLIGQPMRPGIVMWIGLRPRRRDAMRTVDSARLDPETGLVGDHYASRTGGARQLTLIQWEHLPAIGAYLGIATPAPERFRRNIAVAGLNLLALKGRRFHLGGALIEATGECHPCSRMEETLGPGGYNALRGHGGITARVIAGGEAALGDRVLPTETVRA